MSLSAMDQKTLDQGVLLALLDRFEKQRLPRIFDIRDAVKGGKTLSDIDICFLEESLSTAERVLHLVDRNPEFETIFNKAVHLYHEITETALQNENH